MVAGQFALMVIQSFHLARVECDEQGRVRVQNLTLINLVLWLKRDTNEKKLNKILLGVSS